MATPTGSTKKSSSRLENHLRNLREIESGLSRASLQYENLLVKLRGNVPDNSNPEIGIAEKSDPLILDDLDHLANNIQSLLNNLNGMADELNELI